MGASSPMKFIGQWHRFKLYYADQWFTNPGYVLWTGKRHIRIWPLPFKRAD